MTVESGCSVDQATLERVRQALDGHNGADQQLIAETGLELIAMLLRKNADYGSSAWTSPVLAPGMSPMEAIQCRMSDKVARLAGLAGGRSAEVSESVVDTMSDLTGYGMLWLGYAKKQRASVAAAESDCD